MGGTMDKEKPSLCEFKPSLIYSYNCRHCDCGVLLACVDCKSMICCTHNFGTEDSTRETRYYDYTHCKHNFGTGDAKRTLKENRCYVCLMKLLDLELEAKKIKEI